MAQIHVIGRITADLDLKYGQSGNPYVRFSLAENLGSKEHARVQYYQVWAWNEDAVRLIDSKVRKGSLVRISGTLELEVYTKQDGTTTDKRMKVSLQSWDFISTESRGRREAAPQQEPACVSPLCGIDGDRESLPE